RFGFIDFVYIQIIRLRRIGSSGTPNPTNFCEFVRFRAVTVGDGLPVPHKKSQAVVLLFSRNAEDGVPYGRSAIFCIGFICNLSNPQALCASSFAKGAYAYSHIFAGGLLF
ncbi:MAG: hypothetical protein ACI4I3_11560, partial [Acutalibacteraceae bacterium]